MRIEAQGKYLQAVLDKAQQSLSINVNCPGSLEAMRAQLTNFNMALSSLTENTNEEDMKVNIIEKSIPSNRANGSVFTAYLLSLLWVRTLELIEYARGVLLPWQIEH